MPTESAFVEQNAIPRLCSFLPAGDGHHRGMAVFQDRARLIVIPIVDDVPQEIRLGSAADRLGKVAGGDHGFTESSDAIRFQIFDRR